MKLFNVWVDGPSNKEWIVRAVNEFDAYAKVIAKGCTYKDSELRSEELNFSESSVYSIGYGGMV